MLWLCFNPRAREGRDHFALHPGRFSAGFNPRAREGRDHLRCGVSAKGQDVSIHAPVKGATRSVVKTATRLGLFQSTRP